MCIINLLSGIQQSVLVITYRRRTKLEVVVKFHRKLFMGRVIPQHRFSDASTTGLINNWSKNFDKRPHRHLVTPRGSECTDSSKIDPHLKLASLGLHESAPVPNGISIGSAVFPYTTAKAPDAFPWGGQSRKLPFSLGDWPPYLIHSSLNVRTKSAPKRHLDRLGRFCKAHKRDHQTDRLTTLRCGLKMDCYKSVELTLSGDFELSVTHRRTFLSRHNS